MLNLEPTSYRRTGEVKEMNQEDGMRTVRTRRLWRLGKVEENEMDGKARAREEKVKAKMPLYV